MKTAPGIPPVVLSFGGSNFFERDGTINADYVKSACKMLISLREQGVPLCVVVGGGHTAKIYAEAVRKISGNEFYADRLGIRSTRLNALLLISVLDRHAYPHVVDNMDQAFNALRSGLIPLSGGMLEGLSTDTISVLFGERLEASHMVNISNVDAVYSADPKVDPKAKRFTEMTHQELVDLATVGDSRKARTNFVFDLVASKIAARSNLEIHFVTGKNLDGVKAAILRQKHDGTIVRN